VVAGQGSGRTKLAYLTEERAADVRARLLALAHGLAGDTPEPWERPVLAVSSRRLVVANLLAPGPLLVLAVLAVAVFLVVTDPAVAAALAGTAIALGIALGLATAHRVGAEWDFTLAEAPDGLRLKSGLLQTRAETIPHGRAQAVRWVEPLLWRGTGWVRLEIDVARRRDRDRAENEAGSTTRALLPVGTRAEALWLLSRVLPGADITPPPGSRAPRRSTWRAPLSRHNLDAWYDDRFIVCALGRLRRSLVVVPMEKVQSLRWSQGPLSRALRLATVHADTAGRRFPAAALFRDAGQAREWMLALPDLARQARQGAVSR
ncbi:MAG: putative rane protein, partial [Frankiaceae bacterium]|nr:putative rane protein [Frankiaceae bacterium]